VQRKRNYLLHLSSAGALMLENGTMVVRHDDRITVLYEILRSKIRDEVQPN
jgi:hypothetical protein